MRERRIVATGGSLLVVAVGQSASACKTVASEGRFAAGFMNK